MNIQEYHKKINGFKSIYDLAYFLINCLFQIKYKYWGYCFCTDYENRRKCELCVIVNDFSDFEDLIIEKRLDRYLLLDYHKRLLPYLRQLFFAKKLQFLVFLMKFTLTLFDYFCTMILERFI